MWIHNNITRASRRNKSEEENYLICNIAEGNPAIKVSERAKKELGWVHEDFVNIWIDNDKIMIVRDNDEKQFPIKVYKSQTRNYGFQIYGRSIKEVLKKCGWTDKHPMKISIAPNGDDKMILCFKDEMFGKAQMALMDASSKKRKSS